MGSSTSRPRDGHEHPGHLPKVGSPANRTWEHRTHLRQIFGPATTRRLFACFVIIAVAGLVLVML